jgi:hypothetical protein
MSKLRGTLGILRRAAWSLEGLATVVAGGRVSQEKGRQLRAVLRQAVFSENERVLLSEVNTLIRCLQPVESGRLRASSRRDSRFLFWSSHSFPEDVKACRAPVGTAGQYRKLLAGIMSVFTHMFPMRAGCVSELKLSSFRSGKVVSLSELSLFVFQIGVPKNKKAMLRANPLWVRQLVEHYVEFIRPSSLTVMCCSSAFRRVPFVESVVME